MASYDELMRAARNADSSGDADAARRLLQLAADARKQEQAQPSAMLPGDEDLNAGQKIADTGRGAVQGVKNVGNMVGGLVWKGAEALGSDYASDMLSQINHNKATQQEATARFRERSPLAFGGGEFTGELLATLPAGAAGGVVAKTIVNGTRMAVNSARMGTAALKARSLLQTGKAATVAGIAGEGATIGALYNEEGDDMSTDMAVGAGVDLAAAAALNPVTRVAGHAWRQWRKAPAALDQVDDMLTVGKQRVDDAATHGGYDLDGAQAVASQRSMDAKEALRATDEGHRIAAHETNVEGQVAARANEIADGYKPNAGGNSGQRVQRTLTAQRLIDERDYKAAYREFDKMAAETDTYIDTSSLNQKLDDIYNDKLSENSKGLRDKIKRDLGRYGIGLNKADDLAPGPSRVDGQGNIGLGIDQGKAPAGVLEDSLDGASYAGNKPLTLENSEDLIQILNGYYSPNMSAGEKRYLAQVRQTIEGFVDDSLSEVGSRAGVGQEVYNAGRAARDARRAFSENWQAGDVIQKLTERTGKGPNAEWAIDYTQAIKKLSADGGRQNFTKLKAKLLTTSNGKDVWKSIQQTPLLDAIEAATKGQRIGEGGQVFFNQNAFESTLKKAFPNTETMEVVYGKEGAAQINKAISAWKLRTQQLIKHGTTNNSGTAMTLMKQLRFLPSGKSRNVGMAVAGATPVIGQRVQRGARAEAVDSMLQGQTIPQGVRGEMASDILEEWENQFTAANGKKYGDMLRRLMAPGVTIALVNDK